MTPLQEKGKKCEDIARNHYLKQGKKVEKINNGGDFKVTDPDGKILIVEVKTKKKFTYTKTKADKRTVRKSQYRLRNICLHR